MTNATEPPFKRDEFLDKPGIVGARWWHEGLVHADPVGRRVLLQALLVGGGLLTFGVVVSKIASCGGSSSFTTASKNALEMQKQFGWNFGAASQTLTFDGTATQPFQPELLSQLSQTLAPSQSALRPYFIPTLFQSPGSKPVAVASGDPTTFVPLETALRPIFTPAMDVAYRRGQALAALFDKPVSHVAVIVDLPGPESVAFAAGAASVFDPVFAIDNWPHPLGVVPAHLTLAAALYYQPLFAKAPTTRPLPAPPMFVLDRRRLSPYTDQSTQFDNRHVAKLPPSDRLRALGIRFVLYVVPLDTDVPELDDLNDDFVHDAATGVVIKVLGASAFGPGPPAPPPANPADTVYYYGGSVLSNFAFWVDYPWVSPSPSASHPENISTVGRDYVPVTRTTSFASGGRIVPPEFGMVSVVVALETGAVLGALLSRSGSWNRSSGGWGG
jgi:hypothetical protein